MYFNCKNTLYSEQYIYFSVWLICVLVNSVINVNSSSVAHLIYKIRIFFIIIGLFNTDLIFKSVKFVCICIQQMVTNVKRARKGVVYHSDKQS